MRALTPDEVDEVRRLNYVYCEDEEKIIAAAACPDASHRPEKVAPVYLVTLRCSHKERRIPFCADCTAVRRSKAWACWEYGPLADPPCLSRVVRVETFVPVTKEKQR